MQNFHQDGILQRSLAPAPNLTPELQTLAEIYATRTLDALGSPTTIAFDDSEQLRLAGSDDRRLAPLDGVGSALAVREAGAPQINVFLTT